VPPGLRRAVDVAAGSTHTLMLDDLGTVRVWGSDSFGQVSDSSIAGISVRIESGLWSAASYAEPCSDALPAPGDCACGPFQLDWNEDGIADCIAFRFGDLNLDGVIGAQDLAILLANWGDQGPLLGDVNRDGTINALDLSILLGRWGQTL
jgi:hypothetical protein